MGKKSGKTLQGAFLWSSSAEVFVKLISPITNMILARLLAPSAFGVLAVCNMVVSFIEIITDAGFGKYLVQYEFKNEEERDNCANVAFWSNLCLSIGLWLIIVLARNGIASLMGSPDYAFVIPIACIHLVFAGMVSIQTGLLRRSFEFKKLFIARASVALVPLAVTVPLALILRSYWALIIGNISGAVVNSIVLFCCSSWKPRRYYSFALLKQMFSFSFWSLCEAMAHWLIFWVDTFIIGRLYSDYYLGLYKNSANMMMSIFNMISVAVGPVLMSGLARLKDNQAFYSIFLHIEKLVVYLVLPMGIGVFVFREPITLILLGEQWTEASGVIGGWALMMTASIIFYSLPAEAYKAKGVPRYLFLFQLSYLAFLIPVCSITARMDFWTFVVARCLCVLEQILMSFLFMKKFLDWSPVAFLKNMRGPLLAGAGVLGICLLVYRSGMSLLVSCLMILVVVVLYGLLLLLMFRKDLLVSFRAIKQYRVST